MPWGYKIKIRPADKLFSGFIRKRDGRCVYRFKCWGLQFDYKQLQASHFHKRRHESVRFDPKNVDAACKACHNFIENDPEGKKTLEEFKKKQLGEYEYQLLAIRAETYKKPDDFMTILALKEILKQQALTDTNGLVK